MKYKINNKLLINTVSDELEILFNLLSQNDNLEIDLGNVVDIDSAGIACLLEVNHMAQLQNKEVKFINLTSSINNLCQLYQVKF